MIRADNVKAFWGAGDGGGAHQSFEAPLIDLHSHLLPGVDDGSRSDEESLAMARMAVAQGVTVQACTPHMFPGVYDNRGPDIRLRVARLQQLLDESEIELRLAAGGDVHVAPDLVSKLKSGEALTLNDSRYVLIEPPHHILPPRIEDVFFNLLTAGYVPVLTHPERMRWIEHRYDLIQALANSGVWMQLTAGALLGHFGGRPQYWAQRMLDEGLVHIVATDAHGAERRPPCLKAAFDVLCGRVGEAAAVCLTRDRPAGMLADRPADELFARAEPAAARREETGWRRWAAWWGSR